MYSYRYSQLQYTCIMYMYSYILRMYLFASSPTGDAESVMSIRLC